MFCGIVEGKARVVKVQPVSLPEQTGSIWRLTLDLGPLADGVQPGASVSVSGVCLTVCHIDGPRLTFDVVPETWRRTNLSKLQPDDSVNIERSLRFGQPVDGHLVQGHVEGMAEVARIEQSGGDYKLVFKPPENLLTVVVPKGAIALDGVSLTVVDVFSPFASVALIPTTLRETTLGERREGDLLNVETDFLVRAVVQRLEQLLPAFGSRANLSAEAHT